MKDTYSVTITTPTELEIVLERRFDAPSQLVFDALTKPDLLRRWFGPAGWTLEVCEVDLRVGGRWRFVSRRPNGKLVGQKGVYQEIVPGRRLVNTESWEDWDPGETTVTTDLVQSGSTTTLTQRMRFPSREVRDTVLTSGMEPNAASLYDRLAEVLYAEVQAG